MPARKHKVKSTLQEYMRMPIEERIKLHGVVPIKRWYAGLKAGEFAKAGLGLRKDWYTVDAASEILGLVQAGVRGKIRSGTVKAEKVKVEKPEKGGVRYRYEIPREELAKELFKRESLLSISDAWTFFNERLKDVKYKLAFSSFVRMVKNEKLVRKAAEAPSGIHFIDLMKLIERIKRLKTDYLPVSNAAKELGVGRATAGVWVRKGELGAERFGDLWFIPRRRIEEIKQLRRETLPVEDASVWLQSQGISVGIFKIYRDFRKGVLRKVKFLGRFVVSKEDLIKAYLEPEKRRANLLADANITPENAPAGYYARLTNMDPDILARRIIVFREFGEIDLSRRAAMLATAAEQEIRARLQKTAGVRTRRATANEIKGGLLASINITPQNSFFRKIVHGATVRSLQESLDILEENGIIDCSSIPSQLAKGPKYIRENVASIKVAYDRRVARRSSIPKILDMFVAGAPLPEITAVTGRPESFIDRTLRRLATTEVREQRARALEQRGLSVRDVARRTALVPGEVRELLHGAVAMFLGYGFRMARLPALTSSQEKILARRRDRGDKKAADILVRSNIGLVLMKANEIARLYKTRVTDDLIQEGFAALANASGRFSLEYGVRFASYAGSVVEGFMKRHIQRTRGIIRVPESAQDRLRDIHRVKRDLLAKLEREPSPEEIGMELGLTPGQVEASLAIRPSVVSLETPLRGGEEKELKEILAAKQETPAEAAAKAEVSSLKGSVANELKAMNVSERDVQIFFEYILGIEGEATLEAVGQRFNMSRERVRQIVNTVREKAQQSAKLKMILGVE